MMPASDALEAFPRGAVPACYVFGFKLASNSARLDIALDRN